MPRFRVEAASGLKIFSEVLCSPDKRNNARFEKLETSVLRELHALWPAGRKDQGPHAWKF